MTNVRNYTTDELLVKLKKLPSFKYIPKGHHIIAVRSNEDALDVFDDKLYLFRGTKFISVMSCTTNSGKYGLLNFFKWNNKGTAVIKSDEIYYNAYMKSDGRYVKHHNSKMECLRQIAPIKYYRDNNYNNFVDERGKVYYENNSTNIHANSYVHKKGLRSWSIGKWGTGCVVVNDLTKYYHDLLENIDYGIPITLTMLKEF